MEPTNNKPSFTDVPVSMPRFVNLLAEKLQGPKKLNRERSMCTISTDNFNKI